jgi:hypothetical protein
MDEAILIGRDSKLDGGIKEVMRSEISDYLFNLTRTDARGAYIGVLDSAVFLNGNMLQVRQPATLRQVMGVADFVPDYGTFPADIAFPTHWLDLP